MKLIEKNVIKAMSFLDDKIKEFESNFREETQPLAPSSDVVKYLKDVAFRVEADGFAHLALWSKWSEESLKSFGPDGKLEHFRVKWESSTMGYMVTVGHGKDKRPVCLNVNVHKILGHNVLMWYACSQLVDYQMIDEWFKEYLPEVSSTDAMNFHLCVHHLQRLNDPISKIKGVTC